jgi:hypothetical protein
MEIIGNGSRILCCDVTAFCKMKENGWLDVKQRVKT